MISVLIPSYNWDLTNLIYDLLLQSQKSQYRIEIIASDDASASLLNEQNSELNLLEEVSFFVQERNLGRSAHRNFLASKAKYPYLLFIDADSAIGEDFLKVYFETIKSQPDVIVGGTLYQKHKPASDFRLRWKYGKAREQITANIRQSDPYRHFTANNFAIKQTCFSHIKFDESITQYGHEDTLFKVELVRNQFNIIHIDAPVIHLGIETNHVFIEKTKLALQNLLILSSQNKIPIQHSALLQVSKSYSGIIWPFFWLIGILEPLLSIYPNVLLFDLWRVLYINSFSKGKIRS